jgi:histidine triad (HIT) family protein
MAQHDALFTSSDRCTFCKIVRGEATSYMVFEDDVSLAFLDHRPLLRGHCLLVPKTHYETLGELPAVLIAPFFAAVQLVARAVERGMEADGSFIAINNRISQSVPHLHAHVVPRWKKDGLFAKGFIWKRQPYENSEAIATVQHAVRSAVVQLQSEQGAREHKGITV